MAAALPRERQRRLADCLQRVVCQRLLPRCGGGLVAAQEVLVVDDAARALLREDRPAPTTPTLEAALGALVARGLVSRETARAAADHPGAVEPRQKACEAREGSGGRGAQPYGGGVPRTRPRNSAG